MDLNCSGELSVASSVTTGDEMNTRVDGLCIQGDGDSEEEILSISDAVDLAHACSEPASFFDVNGLNDFNVFNTFDAGGGGKHDPTSFLDIRHTPNVLTSRRSVDGDDGVVARIKVGGAINSFDRNAKKHRPINNFQQRTQRRRKTFDHVEQLESTFDANRSAEMPSVRNHQACPSDNGDVLAPLRKWIEGESTKQNSPWQTAGHGEDEKKRVLLLKTTVAYGMAQLLRKSRSLLSLAFHPVKASSLHTQFNMDNFVVRTKTVSNDGQHSQPTWKDIKGVGMLSPKLSVNIVEAWFTNFSSDDNEDEMGRYLEAEFPFLPDADGKAVVSNHSEEDERCHLFGIILCELFFSCSPPAEAMRGNRFHTNGGGPESALKNGDASQEPARKKTQLIDSRAFNGARSPTSRSVYVTLLEKGIPSCLCLVIQSLLECGDDNRSDDAYDSLEAVIKDLHLLLLDPNRFLFDKEPMKDSNGSIRLPFRQHTLYGRENEASIITDAFCRVSSGKIESCFIGGFSGSGKSRLVNDLMVQVDMVGGYVLTRKFDLKERPMLEVVALFNDLCLLIREKNTQQDLLVIVKDLVDVFGSDIYVLARLLPNMKTLLPQLNPSDEKDSVNHMNVGSICFILQRFIRVVSSEKWPVVLFLDDLQWCDKSALSVVESILCGSFGSSCVFFVGTYRSNEVADDHEIFCLARRLRTFGVPTTMLSLEGLNPNDLNTMISDALCLFPRISEPLSDIVFQKTKGNPFFVLAFLRSLVDRGLLEYSSITRTWVWDEKDVSSMDVTGNVLDLLSSKMSELSANIQSTLTLAACFGIKIKESVVATLGTDPKHSDIQENLEQVVKEGFMVKVGTSDFKFVHDKVREAAYSLIPEQEKNQFHYSLGMSLYSMTNGQYVDDVIFSIVDQIKLGIDSLEDEKPEFRIEVAKLNELAGMKAVVCSDYMTSRSYFTYALSLLPSDHWESHYDISLRYSLRLAKSHYSCGDVEKAQSTLHDMIGQCHSFEDKLPACEFLARILLTHKKILEGYTLCHQVLSQFGEKIPLSLLPAQQDELIQETSGLVKSLREKDLLEMKEMDEKLFIFMKFYISITAAAYLAKREMHPFFACRIVQLTMTRGLCESSIAGLVHFAICLGKHDLDGASRIGKAAMSCLKKRYHTSEYLPRLYLLYYGTIAHHTEPLQSCADMLRQGFVAAMSLGETGFAFLNSLQHIGVAIASGERLPTLLDRVDYYLKLADVHANDFAKIFHPIIRGMISELINKGESTSSICHSNVAPDSFVSSILKEVALTAASQFPTLMVKYGGAILILQFMHFTRAIQAFWQGHTKRCQYYIGKYLKTRSDFGTLCSRIILFVDGLNTFRLLGEKSKAKRTAIPNNIKNSIDVLETLASQSSWNFRNKVQLLQAEQFSYQNQHHKAKASYAAAISSARSSGFIHEQGLACELAGYHLIKVGDPRSACGFFEQAKQCYAKWGSLVKVESVTRQLNCVRASMHDDTDDTSGDIGFVGRLFDVVKSYSAIDLN